MAADRAAPRKAQPPQLLILIKGLPGSGKSTLARALARTLRCPLVDKDDARDCFEPLVRQQPQRQPQHQPLTVDWNGLSYDVMFRAAATQLGLGLSVVVDCPFSRRELYDRACALAHSLPELLGSHPQDAPLATVASAHGAAAAAGEREGGPAAGPVGAAAASGATSGAAVAAGSEAGSAAPPPLYGTPPPLYGAPPPMYGMPAVVLVDVVCGDEAVWRRRLEARGAAEAGGERAHKPGSWEELQALLHSYNGSWRWSTDGSTHVPYRLQVCTATSSTEACVDRVLSYLERVLPRAGTATA